MEKRIGKTLLENDHGLRESRRFLSGVVDDPILLGYDTPSLDNWLPAFQRHYIYSKHQEPNTH
jgi:hypothetical protein